MTNTTYNRPYVQIRAFADEENKKYWLETVYALEDEKPIHETRKCDSLKDLHVCMKRCVAYAKRHTYDYDVNFIIL